LELEIDDCGRGDGHGRGAALQNRSLGISSNFRFLLTRRRVIQKRSRRDFSFGVATRWRYYPPCQTEEVRVDK
jgi:hypothetical protein